MSQQYGYPPPPPQPATPSNRDRFFEPPRRRTAQPPSLTTTFLRTQAVGAPSQAPSSGLLTQTTPFQYSPATPVALNPRTPGVLESITLQVPSQRIPPPPPSPRSQGASPSAPAPPPGTPNMAAQPYNPRQWSQQAAPQMGGMVYQQQQQRASIVPADTREVTGMEGMLGLLSHVIFIRPSQAQPLLRRTR